MFVQDLASCHNSRKVQNFINLSNILVLNWPVNSPVLNPIENLRSAIKLLLRRRDLAHRRKIFFDVIIYCRSIYCIGGKFLVMDHLLFHILSILNINALTTKGYAFLLMLQIIVLKLLAR